MNQSKPKHFAKGNYTQVAHVALVLHVEGMMSDPNIHTLARIAQVQLPPNATKYQYFFNGVMLHSVLCQERHITLDKMEILGCFRTQEEAQACVDLYLKSIQPEEEKKLISIN